MLWNVQQGCMYDYHEFIIRSDILKHDIEVESTSKDAIKIWNSRWFLVKQYKINHILWWPYNMWSIIYDP